MPFVFFILSQISGMKEYVIGVDIGTGSLKALAVNASGVVLSSEQGSYPLIQETEDRCEQDPELIWQAFLSCITNLVKTLDESPRAIVLSSAMHSLILVDSNNHPLTSIITWADNRAAEIAERIHRSAAGEMLYEQTGTPIHAMSPLCKITWFRENREEIFNKASRFISLKEFFWFRLFGAYEVDYSTASAEGLMDIESLQWNPNALTLAGITEARLGKLVNTNHTRKDVDPSFARKTGIDPATPFIIGASDGCMANLGSFATTQGIAALTIGTSGAVRVASTRPVFNFSAMTFNYRLDAETYISGGPTNNGGVVLKWYAENFLGKKLASADDYRLLLSKVRTIAPGADGLIFLPYILGERAPLWKSDAAGVFFGLRRHHTQDHFTRAVIEGISMALYNIAENMERSGLEIDQVNVSGGFIHSTEWLEILAHVFGKKICMINSSDASALGAAYLGLKTLGMVSDYAVLRQEGTREILPDLMVFRQYQKQYKLFQDLYQSLAPLMK